MKIGVYGGSFDPVHSGHVGAVRMAMEGLSLDRVIVIPAALSPFKTKTCFTAEQRLELVRLAFAGMPNVVVDDREMKREGVSYTIDTMREIAAENPGAKLYFIVGHDSLGNLKQWKNYDELSKLCEFQSYERTRESSSEVRERLSKGEPIDDLVPKAVAKAIVNMI